jgi:TRAP-type C4-dicarboxylate transport system substrate-binding protein
MNKKRGLVLILGVLLLSLVFVSCGGEKPKAEAKSSDAAVYTMRIGTLTVAPNQCVTTAQEFKNRIETASNGRIKVEVYQAAQLGTAAQLLEGMQAGSVEAAIFPGNFMASAAPIMGFVEVPGICGNDSESFCKIMNGNNNEVVNSVLSKSGLHVAAWLITDKTKYLLSRKPITKIADIKGMKLWGFPNEYTKVLTSILGATPTFFDSSELAVSMQQGTIDGAMAAPSLYAPMKLYEYAKYCMELPGFGGGNAFIMGTAFLDKLPSDLKDMVLKVAMDTVVEYEYPYVADFLSKCNKTLTDNGCAIIEVKDKAKLDEFNKLYEPMLGIFLKIDGAKEFYDKVSVLSKGYIAKTGK